MLGPCFFPLAWLEESSYHTKVNNPAALSSCGNCDQHNHKQTSSTSSTFHKSGQNQVNDFDNVIIVSCHHLLRIHHYYNQAEMMVQWRDQREWQKCCSCCLSCSNGMWMVGPRLDLLSLILNSSSNNINLCHWYFSSSNACSLGWHLPHIAAHLPCIEIAAMVNIIQNPM